MVLSKTMVEPPDIGVSLDISLKTANWSTANLGSSFITELPTHQMLLHLFLLQYFRSKDRTAKQIRGVFKYECNLVNFHKCLTNSAKIIISILQNTHHHVIYKV